MHIEGTLKVKGETQHVSEKFAKRDFVITDNSSQYPQHISFQLTQDRCDLIDNMSVGSEIKVHFNLRGRGWTSPSGEIKHFNTLEAWKLEVLSENKSVSNTDDNSYPAPLEQQQAHDDLPF